MLPQTPPEPQKITKRKHPLLAIAIGSSVFVCMGVVYLIVIAIHFATLAPAPTQTMVPPDVANKADAHYQKASAIINNQKAFGSEEAYHDKMVEALNEINAALALRNDLGQYYGVRQTIYINLAGLETYYVDRQAIFQLALADAYKANELGTPLDDYPERTIIVDLIGADQCDLALKETQKQMDQTPKDQSSYGGLLTLQSQAYACLGKLDEAIKSIDDAMFNNKNMEYKQEQKANYLFQAGRDDEALEMIRKIIICCPSGGGYRYLWRASIYYSRGQKDAARQDAIMGMGNMWASGGFSSYMQAQFAIDDGNKEEAIRLLQLTEASLDPIFRTFRKKVQTQLTALGAKPISPTPSFTLPGVSP